MCSNFWRNSWIVGSLVTGKRASTSKASTNCCAYVKLSMGIIGQNRPPQIVCAYSMARTTDCMSPARRQNPTRIGRYSTLRMAEFTFGDSIQFNLQASIFSGECEETWTATNRTHEVLRLHSNRRKQRTTTAAKWECSPPEC